MLTIEQFVVNELRENCYVVSDETLECVVIDCGAYSQAERQSVLDYIKAKGLQPRHSLLTHFHTDHCIGCDTLYKAYGLRPEVHIDDKLLYEQRREMCAFIFAEQWDESFPAVEHFFTERERIVFGSHTFSILHTPGHSPGSVSFYCKAEGVLFTGDTLFRGGIGRTDYIGGSMFQIIQSLRMLCQLDDEVKVYPGHGEATTIGYECATNPFIDR